LQLVVSRLEAAAQLLDTAVELFDRGLQLRLRGSGRLGLSLRALKLGTEFRSGGLVVAGRRAAQRACAAGGCVVGQ
jgi:hypothetical protein